MKLADFHLFMSGLILTIAKNTHSILADILIEKVITKLLISLIYCVLAIRQLITMPSQSDKQSFVRLKARNSNGFFGLT